jgi:putative membrane protein
MLYILLTGFIMAFADSVPGVSGGTIVFIMGLYDEFITSLSDLFHGSKTQRIAAVKFLIKLLLGWAVGMALAVSVLAKVFVSGIYEVSSLFLGLVAVSIPIIVYEEREAYRHVGKNLLWLLVGVAIVVGITRLSLAGTVGTDQFSIPGALYAILGGFLAITAMVLPGISGSTVLMAFGLYLSVITAAHELLQLDFHSLWLLICLLIGVILSVLFVLKWLKNMLEIHHSAMMYAILGMMIGSLYAIVRGPTTLETPMPAMTWGTFYIGYFLIGCAVVLGLTALRNALERKRAATAEAGQ